MRRLAILMLALAVLAGCGGGGDATSAKSAAAKPVGDETAGSVVQFADCADWRRGTREERVATIVALRGQLTPQRSASAESSLPDDRAYALLDKACTPSFSQSLRLYKLYVKMQGFAPLSG